MPCLRLRIRSLMVAVAVAAALMGLLRTYPDLLILCAGPAIIIPLALLSADRISRRILASVPRPDPEEQASDYLLFFILILFGLVAILVAVSSVGMPMIFH
jgi:hypothetical protein